jgi:cullin 1
VIDTHRLLQLALVQWKVNFFINVQSKQTKLVGAILRLIGRERNGETINQEIQGLVKKVADSLVSLGLDKEDLNKTSLDAYKEHLETPFLEATEKYYEQASEPFLPGSNVSDYLEKGEKRLKEEGDRVDRYLNNETRRQVLHVLIRQHFNLMCESTQNLSAFDNEEDLRRIYTFLSHIPEALEPLRKKFEGHVKKAGLAAVANLFHQGSEGENPLDLKAYVDALLDVHSKNSEVVTRSFMGDARFVASLDKACKEFVNRNAATGLSTTKSSELLVKHMDMLLRKNNKMVKEEDLEGALNRTVSDPIVQFGRTLITYPRCRWCFSGTSKTRTSSRLSMPRNCLSASFTVYPHRTRARLV